MTSTPSTAMPDISLPFRPETPNGGLRRISKAQVAAFNAAVIALMAPFPVLRDLRKGGDPYISWVFDTPNAGRITVCLFLQHADVFNVHLLLGHAPVGAVGVNPNSTHAWHVDQAQPIDAFAELCRKLEACGVEIRAAA